MYCFHHAGGAASFYRKWKPHLPSDINLFALQLPGRDNRMSEPLVSDIEELALKIANSLYEDNKPFIFFGHSMGGLLAFEVTHILKKLQKTLPTHLFVSSVKAPHLPYRNEKLLPLDDTMLLKAISQKYGYFQSEILHCKELLDLLMPRLRSDLAICENYLYDQRAPLPIPIITFGGDQDKSASQNELLEWRIHTTASFDFKLFSGGHFYLDTEFPDIINIITNVSCN